MNQIDDKVRNNEVLKTLTKTLTFVDADANAGGSTTALPERCSGELKIMKKTKDFYGKVLMVSLR